MKTPLNMKKYLISINLKEAASNQAMKKIKMVIKGDCMKCLYGGCALVQCIFYFFYGNFI